MSVAHERVGIPLPFYLDDLEALREKLAKAERDGTLMGRVWSSVRRRAQAAPEHFPWFLPFTALITGEERDLEPARQAIRNYVATFDAQPFGMGLQFHFWCFAFPHARWSLYFQWLHSLGAWEPAEAEHLAQELVTFQFLNFFYGMRTKPDPQCVDNQTMSLCYSNALVGHLFSQPPFNSAVAARMQVDGARRLPSMLGGFPPSGYSGEGSTYMDHVVGPCIPFLTEFLERTNGGDWYSRVLEPNGGSSAAIVRMIAREWMPNGLLLPWDHYGYSFPVRSCIAYGARRTGDPLYFELLEQHANWAHDGSIGWGFDDLIWSLIWWPAERPAAHGQVFPSWAAPEMGAALVSDDSRLYLMQMWDESTPGYPTRGHVNPNALTLCAYGSPLTTDGVPHKDCTAFQYEDTWRDLNNMTFTTYRTNFGPGCAGSHGVLLVDGWEGMRAETSYLQAEMLAFDDQDKSVLADVTPIYREHWPDVQTVRRRARLCDERCWVIEDLAAFTNEHDITARWYLRPQAIPTERGVLIETAEGVRLHLLPLLGPDQPVTRTIAGYPERLDGESLQVNFTQRAKMARWLWLAWPDETRAVAEEIADGWQALADPENNLDIADATQALQASPLTLPFTQPAFMLAELPVVRRWWYRRTVNAPDAERWWLRLPREMMNPRLWVNGVEIDLASHQMRMELLAPQVAMPAGLSGEVEIIVTCECGISQYGKRDQGGTGFSGVPAILVPRTPDAITAASYDNGQLTIETGTERRTIAHRLLEWEG